MNRRILAFLAVCFFGLVGVPAEGAEVPAPGSKERKALMDVLRTPCERELLQKVIFNVEHLKVVGNWAFARVTPLRPDGKPIDYSQTRYREAAAEGVFDAMGEALLQRQDGSWKVVEWRFGATDTEAELWAEKYRIPKDLFQ